MGQPEETMEKSGVQKVMERFREDDSKIHVYKAQNVNACHMEQIRDSARKIRRVIQQYLGTQSDFEKVFLEYNKLSSSEDLKNKQISQQDLTKFIENVLINVGEKEVKKHDIQNFLSIFNYNNHDHTLMEDVAPSIYKEDDNQWFLKMTWSAKKPPPPDEKRFHKEFMSEGKQSNTVLTEEDVHPFNLNKSQMEGDSGNKNLVTVQSMPFKASQGNFRKSSSLHCMDPDIKRLIEKFENRVFVGSTKAYQVFQKFDQDKDGFVSQNDFVNKIREMAILEEREIKPFLDYLDPQSKGYVNFREFSNKLRSGMSIQNEQGHAFQPPRTQPTKLIVEENKSMLPYVTSKIQDLKQSYVADSALQVSTRFGANPPHKDTFQNFQAQKTSPMYISDEERFNKDQNHRIQFQKDEIKQSQYYDQGRVDKLKRYNEYYTNKIQNQVDEQFQREQNKIQQKGIVAWNYEHRAHLQNNWK